MAEHLTKLSDATFDEWVKSADGPLLVEFWADWSGPCKIVGPVFAELAASHPGQMAFAKVNIDDNPELAARFEITSVPTFIVFRHGQQVKRLIGARPKETLLYDLKDILAPSA